MNSRTEHLFNTEFPLHMTFSQQDWQILAQYWYPIALVRDVSEQPQATMLLDMPLVIYKLNHEIIVAKDACPHRGVPLSIGTHDGQGVVCRYHGLRFGQQGKCNRIPAHPDHKISDRFHLKTFPTIERYGLIWCCLLADEQDIPNIPVMPYWDHADYLSQIGRYPIGLDQFGEDGFQWLRHFEVHLPFTATLTIHFPNEGKQVIMNAASPVSARSTRLFAPICRNYDKDLPIEDAYEYNLKIFEEDRLIVETQKPEYLPLDLSLEAHFPADRSSSLYRRLLRKAGFSQILAA